MSMAQTLIGIYESSKDHKEYPVYREIIHVVGKSGRADDNCDIEIYQTACGMTLYFPDEDGSMYCAELGEYLVPKIVGSYDL